MSKELTGFSLVSSWWSLQEESKSPAGSFSSSVILSKVFRTLYCFSICRVGMENSWRVGLSKNFVLYPTCGVPGGWFTRSLPLTSVCLEFLFVWSLVYG